MKKFLIITTFIFAFIFVLSPVLAEEKENQRQEGSEVKAVSVESIREAIKPGATNAATVRQNALIKVRNALTSRWNAYNKLVTVAGNLLDKLQIRIDKAKAAGKDVTAATAAMADARIKLADAKSKMDSLKGLLGTNLDKNGFKNAQQTLQAVHKDLNAIRLDAAKIISNLKSFNSEKESTVSTSNRE